MSGRLKRPLLPPSFATTGDIGKEGAVFYCCLANLCTVLREQYIALLWPGLDAKCAFLCCGQLQCAFVGAGPSFIDLLMPSQRWAWLRVSGTIDIECMHMF